jgi:hypothetical protein
MQRYATAVFAVKIGYEDWAEELVAEDPADIEAAIATAKANGYDRIRVANIELDWDFNIWGTFKTVRTYVNGKTYEAAGPTWPAAIKQLQTILRGRNEQTNTGKHYTNTGGNKQANQVGPTPIT